MVSRLAAVALCLSASLAWSAPVKVIFDTDIGPDCDDVGATAVLHALADRGEVDLLAMMCCTSSPWGAPCLDALNTWFGRPDIPVGTLKDAGFLADPGPYSEQVARRYPHDLATGGDAPDATVLYRRILAGQPDQSVVVLATGPLRNLRRLLESPADAVSPLTGPELVARKVTRLVSMGGAFPSSAGRREGEWNFAVDGASAKLVAERWPTPALFSGYEIGGNLMTGRCFALDTPDYGPLATAYGLYIGYGRDRESWDLTAALAAVRGGADLWPISPAGRCVVDDKGHNNFTPDAAGGHRYLVRREPAQPIEDTLEALMVSARHASFALDHDICLFARDGYGQATASAGDALAAFDRKADTAWTAADGPSWLRFDLPDGRAAAVTDYAVTLADAQPRAWQLQGSTNGGATWTTLDDHSGPADTAWHLANRAAWTSYRLLFPAGSGAKVVSVALLERIEAREGVAPRSLRLDRSALSLPVAQRAPLNGALLPAESFERDLTWTSDNPAVASVKAIGEHTAMVVGRAVGRCQVTATSHDGRLRAACRVTVTAGSLPQPWAFEEVNGPYVPGAASQAGGVFTLTGGGMGLGRWWRRNWDQLALLSQRIAGDAALIARVGAPSRGPDGALAGLMFRESLDRESRFVAVGVQPSGEAVLTWRDSPADENPRTKLGRLTLPVWLRLARRGDSFTVCTSPDGQTWGQPIGQHAGAFTPWRKLGLFVSAGSQPTSSTAQFDGVRLDTGG